MSSRRHHLTKSLVRSALQCPRKLVYASNPKVYPQSAVHVDDPLMNYLSQEGMRFGEYCKRLFPHGVEIGGEEDGTSRDTSLAELVDQTKNAILKGVERRERVTIFEGSVQSGLFYARPDILDVVATKRELRVIEVKSKSWNSEHAVEEKMLTANKKRRSIKSGYLPNVQDVAFQTLVCRLAYPHLEISSWLMMPDRAKKMKSDSYDGPNCMFQEGMIPSVSDTMQAIDGSVATLLNVDEFVEITLSSEISSGSKKGTFKDVVYEWAEKLDRIDIDGSDSLLSPSIGLHCSKCEYRLKDSPEGTYSGFDRCWQEASGLEQEQIKKEPLIVDLYGNTKLTMSKFMSEGKYRLLDLTASDFELDEDGSSIETAGARGKKKAAVGDTITRSQRQLYQVNSIKQGKDGNTRLQPNCIIRRNRLKQIMASWQYPLHFIDFETCAPVVPYYPGMSPYGIFAFQFSHHTMDESLEVRHASQFLHTKEGSPNIAFLKALYNAVGDGGEGTVFQWSPHEHNVLKSMLSLPEASDLLSPNEFRALSALLDAGMVDLCRLASKYCYIDGSGGSSSIKRLLQPTLNVSTRLKTLYEPPTYSSSNFENFRWYQVDENGCARDPYDILSDASEYQHGSAKVSDGGSAAAAFDELQLNLTLGEQDRRAIEKSLLRYCELDTLAMAMIVQAWQSFVDDET